MLLESLEKDLLPIRRQAALELYQAGSTSGLLSRQSGEPMSSYCLRRPAWWSQLQDLDDSVKVSDSIRGEQLLAECWIRTDGDEIGSHGMWQRSQ